MNDIKYINDLITDFGVIPKKLVIALINKENPDTADRLIHKMRSVSRIVFLDDTFLAANRFCELDIRNVAGLWIATRFLPDEGPLCLYPCRFPSVVTFIRNGEAYEIIVINDGEDNLLTVLNVEEDTKYIIAVTDPESVDKIKHLDRFNQARFILAAVTFTSMDDEPEIIFYRRDQDDKS